MNSQAKKVKNEILASKISVIRSLNNEQALKYELTLFFQNLKKSVLKELEEYYSDEFMFQAHADLILAPIFESQQEYYNILRKFNHKEYQFGRKTGRRLVNLARKKAKRSSIAYADKASKTPSILKATIKKDELFGTNPWVEQKLLNQSFTASERTMNRIDSDINKILSDGYRNGKGINVVRNDITKRFDQLSSWEATRIARTEIHNAHNMGTMDIYQEMGVEYTQWIAAHDSRTRTSHLDVDREIIPMGGTYSNGLRYPGDTSGPLKEWINCRCSIAPFVIPDGYIAPSFSPFKEEDLIPTLDLYSQNYQMEQLSQDIDSFKQKFDNSSIKDELIEKLSKPTKKKKHIYSDNLNLFNDQKINDNNLSKERVIKIYNNLPNNLKQFITEIKLCPEKYLGNNRWRAGRIIQNTTKMELYYVPHYDDIDYLEVMYHEIAHSLDYISGPETYNISNSELWKEVFKLDKKYNINNNEMQKRDYYVNGYAFDKSNEYKGKYPDRIYAEDFAESVRLYLSKDPDFERDFKFRYEFLKLIFGDV